YHAIIQFKADDTAYIYDLGSTHGTFVSKAEIPKRTYHPIKVGEMIRFGQSSRSYIFQGPEAEEDKMGTRPMLQRKPAQPSAAPMPESTGVTWGFSDDAQPEDELNAPSWDPSEGRTLDPDAAYTSDPKKALTTWLVARGLDADYEVEEEGHGRTRGYVARIVVPLDSISSGLDSIEGVGRGGRKKEAERAAALDACEGLDRRGIWSGSGADLRNAGKKRLKELLGDDDDDGDSFYDRAGADRKKSKKSKTESSKAETHASLTQKRADVFTEMEELRAKIAAIDAKAAPEPATADADDDLDQFMALVQTSMKDESKGVLTKQLGVLEKELVRLDKLIKIVAPTGIAIPVPAVRAPAEAKSPPAPPAPKPSITSGPSPSPRPAAPPVTTPIAAPKPPSTSMPPPPEAPKRKADPELPDEPGSDTSNQKRRRTYGVISQAEVERHNAVEDEGAIDWIAPGDKKVAASELAKLNASYGY
ncbi:hypothetical protein BDK51DRAFT_30353, partial [Blyttiomyces helicus]